MCRLPPILSLRQAASLLRSSAYKTRLPVLAPRAPASRRSRRKLADLLRSAALPNDAEAVERSTDHFRAASYSGRENRTECSAVRPTGYERTATQKGNGCETRMNLIPVDVRPLSAWAGDGRKAASAATLIPIVSGNSRSREISSEGDARNG